MSQMPNATDPGIVADAVSGHWADRWIPPAARPYARLARLERPIGWWLLMLPGWWALALAAKASGTAPSLWLLLLFFIGAVAMRGAGCTWNDLTDQDIDAKVERTASRPLPSGQVTARQAFIFLVAQALVGLVVLLQLNTATILWSLGSLVIVAAYPFMKRVTDWPQFVLGLAFNWGALVGWTAVTGHLAAAPVALYAGGILYTIGYDTIYACQDRSDDAIVGVRSTALLFGDRVKGAVALFYLGVVALFAASLWLNGSGPLAWAGLAGFGLHLAWQLRRFTPEDSEGCRNLFRSNQWAGLVLFAGLALDAVAAAA